MLIKKLFILGLCVFVVSCASTSLVDRWKSDDATHPYQKPMVIGISDSQQTRQVYEKYFIAELKKKNITATPSYILINSKQKINRETVIKAIQGTDRVIDTVLVTYRVADNAEFVPDESIIRQDHEGHDEHNLMSATIVTKRGRSRSSEKFMLKTDMYAVDTRSLIWSAQTESVGPDSVDQVITEVIEILIKELFADDMLTEESLTDELLKYINIQ